MQHPEQLIGLFNALGIFVFAISGAAAGIRKRADLFGIAVLAFAAACCGGVIRDLLLGSLPPENIRSWQPLAISLAGGAATVACYPLLTTRLNNPVQFFDALGLGLFTVLGAQKALFTGIGPVWAALLGVITGVGGGMARDILLAQMPSVLRSQIYAIASLTGAAIFVAGEVWPLVPRPWPMLTGALVCIVLRCVALRYDWQAPVPYRNLDQPEE